MHFLTVSDKNRKEILIIFIVISFILVCQMKKLGSLCFLLHIHMLKARQSKLFRYLILFWYNFIRLGGGGNELNLIVLNFGFHVIL
jgi:hypothetical protein